MNDPIAATDQAVEEIKGVARVHCAYFLQCIEVHMDWETALSMTQQMIWAMASRGGDDDE